MRRVVQHLRHTAIPARAAAANALPSLGGRAGLLPRARTFLPYPARRLFCPRDRQTRPGRSSRS
eukprot:501229-Hanusia_phi.AAC.1